MKSSTTIFEIAKILKLSPSTVSRALKNHQDISEVTKQRVLELAKKLDYEPNAFAVGLRTNNTHIFGVIVPTISGFFYDSFIASIEEEARKAGYALFILQSSDDPDQEIENIKLCKQNRVSGVFACLSTFTEDITDFQKLKEKDVPVIFFDKVPSQNNCNKVCLADAQAADLAANVLKKKNKKRILSLFGDIHLSITQRRLDEYQKVFAGTSSEIMITHVGNTEESRSKTHEVFSSKVKPDAIFCMSDEILIGVMKALEQLRLKVPDDVSVITLSNGFFPKLYWPEITYVETSGYKLGKLAYKRMMDYIEGNTADQELIIESVLVEGGSI
ncbi:MAG: LacI family DNA-binding transcriptional regulator [Chryseolinea sp.]